MDSATATQFDRLASVDCNAPRGFCFSHLCLWLLCLLFLLQSLTASEANGVAFQSLLLLKEFRAVESNLGSKLPSCLWHTASLPPAAALMLHSVRPPPPPTSPLLSPLHFILAPFGLEKMMGDGCGHQKKETAKVFFLARALCGSPGCSAVRGPPLCCGGRPQVFHSECLAGPLRTCLGTSALQLP